MENLGLIIIILIIVGLVLFYVSKKMKHLKIDNVYFISGGVKTGKSFVSVALAVKTYKKNLLRYYIRLPFAKLVCKLKRIEYTDMKPMLYSNIPLRHVRHNALTMKIIERKVRIPNKSVVLIDEISLLADSMLYKDKKINDELMIFIKLFGHYTHGGTLITNSQAIADCHFSIKRCLSHYLYINSRNKYPFVTNFKCREMLYSDDGSAINTDDDDIESSLLSVWFSNKYYKYYDSYCYSIFTDCLPYHVDYKVRVLNRRDNLKADKIISLQDFDTLDRRTYAKRVKRMKEIKKGVKKDEKK